MRSCTDGDLIVIIGEDRQQTSPRLVLRLKVPMSLPVTSDSSHHRYDRPLWAVIASLVLHAVVVAPFFLELPRRTAEAPVEPSVTVEIVPEPEVPEKAIEAPKPAPEPEKEEAASEKVDRAPPGKARPEQSAASPPPGAKSAPAEPTPSAAASQPFEASAAEEPDAPPDPLDMPAPNGMADEDEAPPRDPAAEAPSKLPDAGQKQGTAASTTTAAPVAEQAPEEAASPTSTPALQPKPTGAPPAVPQILAGKMPSGEEVSSPQATPEPAPEAPATEKALPPPPVAPPAKPDSEAAEVAPAASSPEGESETPMTPTEQAAFVPATPVVPQAKPTPSPAPKPAKTLYSKNILSDPRVRGALGKLPPEKRIVQMCSIEAAEQARRASTAFTPDLVQSFGKNGGSITAQHLSARGGAVRSRGVWREMTFDCTVNTAFDAVTAFRFALGETIPRSAWAARGLVVD